MKEWTRFAGQLTCALVIGAASVGCGSQTGQAQPPVVEVSGGQTVASSDVGGAAARESEDESGPIGLVGRILDGRDSDDDGIADSEDRCPDAPEDRDGFEDRDGCPDLDNDGDGIVDADDQCPNDPETMNGYQDDDGCSDAIPLPIPPANPPSSNLTGAKQAFHEGATKYAQGDYAGARAAFELAYQLAPHDAVLFNLAMTAYKQGDIKAACSFYRKWRNSPHGSSSTNSVSSLETCPP